MQVNKYVRIITAFFGSLWAIQPEKLEAMAAFLRFASHGGKYSADELSTTIAARPSSPIPMDKPATLAVIPIRGIISQRAELMDDISGPGGTSTESISRMLRSAINDPTVDAIVLDIDSPGGTVYGVSELSDEIYRTRGKKPITSAVNSLAASAAYWIGSAADEMEITPGGEAGSIGIYSQHTDVSKWLEAEGEKVTLIHAGEFKVEGNPYEPLSEEARRTIQARVDDYYSMFTKAVSRNRGVSIEKVRNDFGKGRVLGAKDAVSVGMVDRVATFDQTIQRLVVARKKQMQAAVATDIKADDAPKPKPLSANERERRRLDIDNL